VNKHSQSTNRRHAKLIPHPMKAAGDHIHDKLINQSVYQWLQYITYRIFPMPFTLITPKGVGWVSLALPYLKCYISEFI
jgi:hypothetical protein